MITRHLLVRYGSLSYIKVAHIAVPYQSLLNMRVDLIMWILVVIVTATLTVAESCPDGK